MITKEQNIKKYCCLYVSDFHLEMILLPFIKTNLNNSNIIIFTENNLENTINKLLERTNFKIEDKDKILKLKSWTNKKIEVLKSDSLKKYTIIINGSKKYIEKIEDNLKNLVCKKIEVVYCFDINKNEYNLAEISKNYNQILNTKKF